MIDPRSSTPVDVARSSAPMPRDARPAAAGPAPSHAAEQAIRLDPRHVESYRNVDYLLAKRGDRGGIVERWTRHIELEPMSGQPYLARGGALHHNGDETAAVADLREACGLGEREACALAERVGG